MGQLCRVIDLVAETITDHIGLLVGQTLIIDYVDCPVKFKVDMATGKVCHTYMTDVPPMGECDVKFTRWGRMYGDMIAHSVDGDFIPIALLEHERNIRLGASQFKIGLYRMEYNMTKAVTKKRGSNGALKIEPTPKKKR